MIRVLAIDDEPLALQQLSAYVKKIPFFELVASCPSAMEARELLDAEPVDAIFCDINMPDLNGLDFVRSLAVPPLLVFTTAYSEYALEGYRVNAIDYLLKPFGLQDFQRAAMKVKAQYDLLQAVPSAHPGTDSSVSTDAASDDGTIFVKTDSRTVRVRIADIRYVEAMSEYLKLYLEGQPRPLITYLSMKKMEEFLPVGFMRIHRSYIVNLQKVQEVNKNRVIMGPEEYLPVGENYRETFFDYINSRLLTK
jgi:DNA-binding LytR/AlgR family response regulator